MQLRAIVASVVTCFIATLTVGAQDVPTIPIWQGGQVAAVRDGVHGVEDTFDAAYLFRLWVISKD